MKKRILITGSSGMFGTDLCRELSGNYELCGIDIISNSGRAGLNLPCYRDCDITDGKSVADAIADFRPDVVIHTAAWTDVDGCELDAKKAYKINSEGTKNIALCCRKIGAILIYISTDFVFDGKKKRPYKESDSPKPLSVYGDSKLKGEEAILSALKKYFIIRTSWLYGKNGKNFVDTILAKAKTEKELRVVDDQIGSPTYTKDLAKALRALLKRIFSLYATRYPLNAKYGTYHVSNSGSVSWFDYAKTILKLARTHELASSRTKIIPISSKELARPARRPAMSVMDNSKFERYTGYKMRDWKEALKEYLTRIML